LGPRILAGVNGSGKSTVLRTIPWALDQGGRRGFNYEQWEHASGHPNSRALILFGHPAAKPMRCMHQYPWPGTGPNGSSSLGSGSMTKFASEGGTSNPVPGSAADKNRMPRAQVFNPMLPAETMELVLDKLDKLGKTRGNSEFLR